LSFTKENTILSSVAKGKGLQNTEICQGISRSVIFEGPVEKVAPAAKYDSKCPLLDFTVERKPGSGKTRKAQCSKSRCSYNASDTYRACVRKHGL